MPLRVCWSQYPTIFLPSPPRWPLVHRMLYQRMLSLHRHAITDRQVGGSDKEQIHSIDRRNLIDAIHGFLVFYLKDKKGLFISVL